jgi:dienelactone hydrolase
VKPVDALRRRICDYLGLAAPGPTPALSVRSESIEAGYVRQLVSYPSSDGESIDAFLLTPSAARPRTAIVALHQHNSEWALGKSEIAGIAGDVWQGFGPALAREGVTVLAPDAVGFESRSGVPGYGTELAPQITRPYGSREGWLHYYNQAMHRLVRAELLMRKVLNDVSAAVSVLYALPGVERVGVVGHSYGGNIALFAAGLDERIAFTCSSGAACSYRHKFAHGTGLEMALVIPGFAEHFDLDDLMRCTAPRKLLVVSAEDDAVSADAGDLITRAAPAFDQARAAAHLEHLRFPGAHALDEARFTAIVAWLLREAL